MVKYKSGNIFDDKSEFLVNAVNCVGVMGKGIAAQFKEQYPDMYSEYEVLCSQGKMEIGWPFIWKDNCLFESKTIINMPTKIHWQDPSDYKYIAAALKWFRTNFSSPEPHSVALPALGCGNGGLDWEIVKLMIEDSLVHLEAIFTVYEPLKESKKYWSS